MYQRLKVGMKKINVYSDESLELLNDKLNDNQSDMIIGRSCFSKISYLFLQKIVHRKTIDYYPIIVLRGGLLMYSACLRSFNKPHSFLIPPGNASLGTKLGGGDIALCSKTGRYLMVDTIVNSGKTIVESIELLEDILGINAVTKIEIAFIFGTKKGLDFIRNTYPNIEIHCIWPKYKIGEDGLLIGINYDAGNYAVNQKEGDRIIW